MIRLLLLSLCCTSLAVDAHGRGTWLWKKNGDDMGATGLISSDINQQSAITFLNEKGITQVYGSYGALTHTMPTAVRTWNSILHQQGIESHYLMAESSWIWPDNRSGLIKKLQERFIHFQEKALEVESFKGLHLDIEPQALNEWKQATTAERQTMLWHLIDTLKLVKEQLAISGLENTKIFADIPVWYDTTTKLAWEDGGDAFFEALMEVTDGVSIMAYNRDDASAILEASSTERQLESHDFSIRLAVDISETWSNEVKLEDTLKELENIGYATDIHDFTDYFYWLLTQE